MKEPKRLYFNQITGKISFKKTSLYETTFYSKKSLPDNRTIIRLAMNHTIDGDNADIIFKAFKAGLEKLKSIIKTY